jgi:hypothetical protein
MTTRRNKTCDVCGGVQEKSKNDDCELVWVCRCCLRSVPRQTRKSRKRRERDALLEELLGEEL